MKKTLLLAGVSCLFAVSANAMDMGGMENDMKNMMKPYVGLDYVYSSADYKDLNRDPKKSYNSGSINIGTKITPYASIEAFFQQSGKRKSFKGTADQVRTEFYAYGLDAYGYMPLGCSKFNLLGTLGLAEYNMKAKYIHGSVDKQRMGYRVGLGAQYDFNEHFAARVVGRYSFIGAKNLDNLMELTAGVRYSF